MIAVQIKCGESWFSSKSKDGYIFTGSLRHLGYWKSHSLPVILVLYNQAEKQAYWTPIDTELIQLNKDIWKITVPFNSLFNSSSKEKLSALAIPDYRKRQEIKEIIHRLSHETASQIGAGGILNILSRAETYLDLVFPFIDSSFFWAIKTLSSRIRIRLVTSTITDKDVAKELIQWIDESPGMEVRIWVPQDKGSQLHSKYFILDGKMVAFGSANFTKLSWRETYESVLASDDHLILDQFREQFDQLWVNSTTIDSIKHLNNIDV